jgi:hypothetical protein
MTAEPAAREPRPSGHQCLRVQRGAGRSLPTAPDTRGDMDVPTTPLHHHARGRHDQPLGRERRHQVPRSRRSPRSVRHRPRYRPMQRRQDPGPIQRLAPCRSGQDPKAAGMWSSRFRKDDRSSTTLPRLASGCLKVRFFVASSMRARRRTSCPHRRSRSITEGVRRALARYAGWGMRIVFVEDDDADTPLVEVRDLENGDAAHDWR